MKSTNSFLNINLSENYPESSLKNLGKVFPQLNNILHKQSNSYIFSSNTPMIVDKFTFYKMILEKLKNYFEVKETFIISDSIGIILKDLKYVIEKVNYAQPIKNDKSNKVKLPLINRCKTGIIRTYLCDEDKSKITSRKSSAKSNGNKKVNNSNSPHLNNSFYFDEFNSANIKQVYLNLEKPKLKIVHFADTDTDNETKRNEIFNKTQKKPNLKKSNFKNKNMFNKTINFKLSDNNYNINKDNLTIKTKTSYATRNKSNGTKLNDNSKNKENNNKEICQPKNSVIWKNETNLNILFNIDDKDFNIFEFEKNVGKENTLPLIGKYIYNYFNFGDIINQSKYINWCKKITEGYNRNNPYHTDLHAADITHTTYIYFKVGLINDIIKIDSLSVCALFLSCLCHDYKHPGINNNYLIETNNPIALNFNDISVLENMHISETFKLIHSNEECNIFDKFEKNNYKKIRKQMISCVLNTDMSLHKESLDFMNKFLNNNDNKNINIEQYNQDFMNLIIHSADISNPTKSFDIYYKWAELVVEEFYLQGDKEKELGLNCSCDRNIISLYKSQLGFIDYIEIPFYGLFVKVFPKLKFVMDNLNNNRERIKLLEDDKKKNKEEKNKFEL